MHRKVPKGCDRVVTLACMEDGAIGPWLTVFLGNEGDCEPLAESRWEAVTQRGFGQSQQFSTHLNTLRWNCVTATDAELFKAPYRASIDFKAYQLEPLREALLMPRVGLFIADDMGLGKTSEHPSRMELLEGGIGVDSELVEPGNDEMLDLEDAQTRSALRQTLQPDSSDQQLLEATARIATAQRHRPDPRIEKLVDWMQQHLRRGLGSEHLQWQPTRRLSFTDYVGTTIYRVMTHRQESAGLVYPRPISE